MASTTKFVEEYQEYTWENCALNRRKYGEFLLSVLTSHQDGFVMNLNGAWGSGKTELLKRLYSELRSQKYPVVYIDAWESDFLDDPLVLICSEVLSQLQGFLAKDEKHQAVDKTIEVLSSLKSSFDYILKLSKASEVIGVLDAGDLSSIQKCIDVLPSQSDSFRSNSISSTNSKVIDSLCENHQLLVDAMHNVRRQMTILSSVFKDIYNLNIPIVILIDELDRCRPSYAIKMLEVIKHLFEVEGCAFLLATDTRALESSIKAVYGAEFDSARYLTRFFNQRISIPDPNVSQYVSAFGLDLNRYDGIQIFPNKSFETVRVIGNILTLHSLSLRDVHRILKRLESVLEYVNTRLSDDYDSINIIVLVAGIIEHHLNDSAFEKRESDKAISWNNRYAGSLESCNYVIQVQLDLVTTSYEQKEYSFNGPCIQSHVPISMLRICGSNYQGELPKSVSSITTKDEVTQQIKLYKDSPKRYMLWNVYKSLIGLSMHIE